MDLLLRRQLDHLYDVARGFAVAMDAKRKLQEIAAKDLGGKPEDYEVANERVFRKGGGPGMSLARAAQRAIQLGGIYDGHELPKDINKFTVASATALAGQGLLAVARDNYPQDGLAIPTSPALLRSKSTSKLASIAFWIISDMPIPVS